MEVNKVISIGFGVQSTTMYFMSSLGVIPRADIAFFADPKSEDPRTYEYIKWVLGWAKENNGIKIISGSRGSLYQDTVDAIKLNKRVAQMPLWTMDNGSIGIMPRQCTSEYKIDVVRKEYRKWLGLKPRQRYPLTETWIGISLDEVSRAKPSNNKWEKRVYPLIDKMMTRGDCVRWLQENGFSIPPKSSCTFCPFHSNYYWLKQKRESPEIFESNCQLDDLIRKGYKEKGIKSDLYLYKGRVPLREATFNENQEEMFDNECEGYCGI